MSLHEAIDIPGKAATAEPAVLFVTRKWAPAVGGMETYSLRLTETLGDEVEIVALPGRADGMPPSARSLLGFPFTILRRWRARKSRPAVLHIGDMALWPVGLLARGETKVVLSAHGTDVAYHRRGGLKGGLYGAYLKLGARLLEKATVIANSRATRAVAAETGWRKCEIVPLATDIAGQVPDGSHNGRLLFAGRLIERKGCGWFVREVLPRLPEGVGLDVAGTLWSASERALADDPRVRFLGPLAGEELARAYRKALCVIVPNIPMANGEYEGFGLVAPEAAAAGGVVLASRCDGLVDAVIDTTTGYLVEPANARAWRGAIAEVLGWTGERRRAFLTRSVAEAQRAFSWERVAADVRAIYASRQA